MFLDFKLFLNNKRGIFFTKLLIFCWGFFISGLFIRKENPIYDVNKTNRFFKKLKKKFWLAQKTGNKLKNSLHSYRVQFLHQSPVCAGYLYIYLPFFWDSSQLFGIFLDSVCLFSSTQLGNLNRFNSTSTMDASEILMIFSTDRKCLKGGSIMYWNKKPSLRTEERQLELRFPWLLTWIIELSIELNFENFFWQSLFIQSWWGLISDQQLRRLKIEILKKFHSTNHKRILIHASKIVFRSPINCCLQYCKKHQNLN